MGDRNAVPDMKQCEFQTEIDSILQRTVNHLIPNNFRFAPVKDNISEKYDLSDLPNLCPKKNNQKLFALGLERQ